MHRAIQNTKLIRRSDYEKALARSQLGNNVANHMSYIFPAILYDKFDFTFTQVKNFYERTIDRRMAWQDDDNTEVTSVTMMDYCSKKKIDVIGFVKSIPMSQKIYLADVSKCRAVVGADRNIESAFASALYLTIPTLKDTYRFSNARIEEFKKWVKYYIDSYCRKQPGCKDHYLSDQVIRQMFIEDEGWDITKGEKVGDKR